jgi:hypothetical protein
MVPFQKLETGYIRRDAEKGICSPFNEKENVLLQYIETETEETVFE